MADLIGIAIFIGFYIWLIHKDEWKACNRTTPPGYTMDWLQMSEDTRKYGKQYTFEQINKGKYDKKIEK